jgi:pyridoxal phosphate enzyme (YggS family)
VLIAKNLQTIKFNIARYEQKYGKQRDSVCLVAASKGQAIEKIQLALRAGQHIFGENYLTEALPKIELLKNEAIEWHYLGEVQSNKTRKIAEHFSWVHTLTSIKIAKRLNEHRPAHLPPLNICIEINVSQEASKLGVEIDQVTLLAKYCLSLPQLKFRGLMTLPRPRPDMTGQREEFYKLNSLQRQLAQQGIFCDTLSMGMSADYEAAIAEGATMVRIGTAIFGPRDL